jgi:hypothetical protein
MAFVMTGCHAKRSSSSNPSTAASSPLSHTEQPAADVEIEVLENALKEDLTDPDSAKFRRLTLFDDPENPGLMELCGEVNAKNRMGGYAGYRGFTANGYFKTPKKLAEGPLMSGASIEDLSLRGGDRAFQFGKESECKGTIVAQRP